MCQLALSKSRRPDGVFEMFTLIPQQSLLDWRQGEQEMKRRTHDRRRKERVEGGEYRGKGCIWNVYVIVERGLLD